MYTYDLTFGTTVVDMSAFGAFQPSGCSLYVRLTAHSRCSDRLFYTTFVIKLL